MLATPFRSAKALAADIRKKKIGCRELLDLYLERVEKHNPEINAIIAMDVEGARKRARAADRALGRKQVWGPLHGVPMTIKESYDVVGMPTTWGVPELKDNLPRATRWPWTGCSGRAWCSSARPTCPSTSPTIRATTRSTAPPTIRGISPAAPAAPPAARRPPSPPDSPASRRGATSAPPSAIPPTTAACTVTSPRGAWCRPAARRCPAGCPRRTSR